MARHNHPTSASTGAGAWLRRATSPLSLVLLSACAAADHVPAAYVESCDPVDHPRGRCIGHVPPAADRLRATPVTVRVDAQCRWNRTGIRLEPGVTYELSAVVVQPWIDLRTEADLDTGWSGWVGAVVGPLASALARFQWQPMYALVGSEGQDPSTFFVAGHRARHLAATDGELHMFANDWDSRYRNNRGCADVTIRRLGRRS